MIVWLLLAGISWAGDDEKTEDRKVVYDTFRAMSPPAQLLGAQITDNSLTAADVVYSFDDAYKFKGRIKALSVAASAVDVAYFVSDSVNLYGTLMKNVS